MHKEYEYIKIVSLPEQIGQRAIVQHGQVEMFAGPISCPTNKGLIQNNRMGVLIEIFMTCTSL